MDIDAEHEKLRQLTRLLDQEHNLHIAFDFLGIPRELNGSKLTLNGRFAWVEENLYGLDDVIKAATEQGDVKVIVDTHRDDHTWLLANNYWRDSKVYLTSIHDSVALLDLTDEQLDALIRQYEDGRFYSLSILLGREKGYRES